MPIFENGNAGKQKGTENKVKGQLKELFGELVSDVVAQYEVLDIKQKLFLLEKIMPYVVAKPAIEQVVQEGTEDKPEQGIKIGDQIVKF